MKFKSKSQENKKSIKLQNGIVTSQKLTYKRPSPETKPLDPKILEEPFPVAPSSFRNIIE